MPKWPLNRVLKGERCLQVEGGVFRWREVGRVLEGWVRGDLR